MAHAMRVSSLYDFSPSLADLRGQAAANVRARTAAKMVR
jgi:hypothetical protein